MFVSKQRLFLLDGHSLAFRAFFALPLLSTASGRFTNATYGFAMMLTRLLEDNEPDYIAVAFDAGKPTERLKLYADYKGTRDKTPGEMAEQIPYIKEILAAYNIPMLELPGYEADDIIGTLAKQATAAGLETVIVTGDRDTLQLVSETVTVWLTRRGITDVEVYDEAAVRERYGLEPKQLIDLKALMGDSSDNIPGVPGIGEKTGIKLLKQAQSLDALLAHPEAYTSKKTLERLRTYH
ncbi:MAG: DNA polymerase I, partial [Firmicutes bacterium]|nr:DNA polymerase I [Bacillota bacterium]